MPANRQTGMTRQRAEALLQTLERWAGLVIAKET
jgi:hypothetical protein